MMWTTYIPVVAVVLTLASWVLAFRNYRAGAADVRISVAYAYRPDEPDAPFVIRVEVKNGGRGDTDVLGFALLTPDRGKSDPIYLTNSEIRSGEHLIFRMPREATRVWDLNISAAMVEWHNGLRGAFQVFPVLNGDSFKILLVSGIGKRRVSKKSPPLKQLLGLKPGEGMHIGAYRPVPSLSPE